MNAPLDNVTGPGRRFVAVFSGDTDLKCLQLLKPGFRHCCVMVEAGRFWVFYNPTSRGTDIAVFDGLTLDAIAAWFLGAGHVVYCGRIRDPGARLAPQRMFTCVEAVKRILGVRAPAVLTPWQLYRWFLARRDEAPSGPWRLENKKKYQY